MWVDNDFRPEIEIKVEFEMPSQIDHKSVRAWINHLRPYPDLVNEPFAEFQAKEDVVIIYIEYCFHLILIFFQICRVAVFNLPRLVLIERIPGQENRRQAKFILNGMRFLPIAVYEQICKTGFYCTYWVNGRAMSPTDRGFLYKYLETTLTEKFSTMVAGGKSTLPVLQIANELGIPFLHLGMGVFQVGWGSKARRLDRSSTDGDSAIGSKMSAHKVATANLLRMAGMPTPLQRTFKSLGEIKLVMNQLPYPVVIKPTDGERGEGVTIDVMSSEDVTGAFEIAIAASARKEVLVEKQVTGVCYRFFIACGSLLYAVRRNPMSVFGDGHRTVEQLLLDECIAQSEKAPWNRSEIKPMDAEALLSLRLAGFSRDSVPSAGTRVPLRRIESTQNGGIDEDVTESAHPENIALAVRAATMLGIEIAGVDIISPEISRPWYENGAVINEVNFAPLLGGAEISRSYLPTFFSRLIEGNGRIPVEVYDHQATAREALFRNRENGLRCFFVSEQQTLDDCLVDIHLCCASLSDKVIALLCRSDVDAIVVWRPYNNDLRN